MDSDADSQFARSEAGRGHRGLAAVAPVLLNAARRKHGVSGMLLPLQRKVEDRHDGVADGLVEEALMLPDRARTFVIERVEQSRDGIRRLRLRQAGVASQ